MSDAHRELELLQSGTGWRHWEMEHFDASNRPPAAKRNGKDSPKVAAPTAQGAGDTGNDGDEKRQASDDGLAEARQRLEKERLEAKAEGYTEGFEKGRKEGYESGLAGGRKAANEELERARREVLGPLRTLADEYGAALTALSEETTAELVELALAVGESMALRCVDEDRMLITRVVKSILDGEIAPSARPELLLNPADIAALTEAFGDELSSSGWQLVPDEKITRGGCTLRNDLSEIDATWESRWRSITARLRRRAVDETAAAAESASTASLEAQS